MLSLAGQAVFVLLQLWHGPVRGHTAAHMAALGVAHSAITLLMLKFPELYWRNRWGAWIWELRAGGSASRGTRMSLLESAAADAFHGHVKDCTR